MLAMPVATERRRSCSRHGRTKSGRRSSNSRFSRPQLDKTDSGLAEQGIASDVRDGAENLQRRRRQRMVWLRWFFAALRRQRPRSGDEVQFGPDAYCQLPDDDCRATPAADDDAEFAAVVSRREARPPARRRLERTRSRDCGRAGRRVLITGFVVIQPSSMLQRKSAETDRRAAAAVCALCWPGDGRQASGNIGLGDVGDSDGVERAEIGPGQIQAWPPVTN